MKISLSIYSLIFVISIAGLLADDEGLINYKNKNFDEAKKYYEQIIRERENDAAANLGLGASQYQLGDIPNAAKSFEEALKSENINIKDKAYYNLGNSFYSQQKMEESLAFYRKALELNPNDDDAKFNYELAKYITQQQQEQNQDQQNDQEDQQNQEQNKSQNDNQQDNDPQNTDKQDPDKQEEEESDSSQEEQREAPKSQKQMNAEAILDALKDEEKIHQKVKMAQQSARKFEKDW
ncbi:MAG: tetratricopeptide repeat protein [Candidatus Neomarinimicrobiota bacterium]